MKHTLYTVRKNQCNHGSTDGLYTICGNETDERYEVVDNTFDGEITCKKCLIILEKGIGGIHIREFKRDYKPQVYKNVK